MKRKKFVPELFSENPMETGARYTSARHRYMIAEKFDYDLVEVKREYRTKNEQLLMLSALKAEDPKKYNKWFNILVCGSIPDQEIIEQKVEIPEELIDDVKKQIGKILEYEGKNLQNVTEDMKSQLLDISKSIALQTENWESHFVDKVEEKINIESKKLNKTVIVVKTPKKKEITIKNPIPEQFETIIDLVSQRMNILLVGPSGCGKTKLSYMVSEATDMDFAAQSCSAGMSESSFSGWLLPVEENGRFIYVQSEFIRLYENGGMFLFDEIDAADANTLLFLNQALANDRFYLPQRFEKPMVKRHPDFVAIAAANTHGNGATAMYSGRNILDGATMDRFRMGIVAMDYSAEVEEKLVDPKVLEWGRSVREIINKKSIRKIMSTRLLLDATKMKNGANWSFGKISDSYFSDWSSEERRMVADDSNYRNKFIDLQPVDKTGLSAEQAENLMKNMANKHFA